MTGKLNAGERLAEIRRELGYERNQTGFGEKIGKSQGQVSHLEKKENIPEVSIRSMSDFLKSKGFNPDYLRYPNAPKRMQEILTNDELRKENEILKNGNLELIEKINELTKSIQELVKIVNNRLPPSN